MKSNKAKKVPLRTRRAALARVAATAALASALAPAAARADEAAPPTVDACVSAYEDAQRLRQAGELRAAMDALVVCAHDACPSAARGDCSRWLDEVQTSLPTVVIEARDERGRPVEAVRVHVDGREMTSRLDGRALSVDPGHRTFRFERDGASPIVLEFPVLEGRKNQVLSVSWAPTREPAPPLAPRRTPSTPDGGGPPLASWVLGGVGVAGLGAFAIFGLKALGDERELRGRCTRCPDADVDAVFRTQLVADLSLGVGVLALGAAAIVWVGSGSKRTTARAVVPNLATGRARRPTWSVDVAPTRGGAATALRARF